ncbi:tetratricopeptide repeat protein [Nocardioides sp. AE5]|uniref:O-antigen ligase family protein n=1 Tax=Nocardioides sp. AE5 TaxID=2962573 RepID=UPI0028822564|nr:tetratricopeptide repeat protein [Nocardioides sp. AE5]MDT0200390.1 tetratricopeptide repeat protein [Nocardioides sp. AE5]
MPLSTLAIWPGAHVQYVAAKLILVALAVAVGVWALPAGRLRTEVHWLLAAGGLVLATAVIASPDPAPFGRWPRHEGLLVVPLYVLMAWLGARLVGHLAEGHRMTAFRRALALTAVVLAVCSLLQAGGWWPGATTVERPGALLGNATDQGIIGLLVAAVLGREAITERHALAVAGTVAGLATMLLSGSRAVLLAGLCVVGLHAVLSRRAVRWQWLGGAALLIGFVLLVPQARDRLLASGTVRGRLELWGDSLALAREHPLLGVGPGGFVDRIGEHHSMRWAEVVGVANPPDSPHNWMLQALLAGGVLLLGVAVALAVVVLRRGWHKARESPYAADLLGAVVGYGLVLLTHFTSPGTTCLAAFVAGALVAVRPTRARSTALLSRAVPPAAVVAAVLVVVVWSAAGRADMHLEQGLAAAARGEVEVADREFTRAHELKPWDHDIAVMAAASLAAPASYGDPGAQRHARAWAITALTEHSRSTQAAVALAVVENSEGRFERAVELLDRTIARDPTAVQPWVQRGVARYGLRDVAGATADLRHALELDPDDPIPARLLAAINERAGR